MPSCIRCLSQAGRRRSASADETLPQYLEVGKIETKNLVKSMHKLVGGAQERTRTSTAFTPLVPETSASTNSATWAGSATGGHHLEPRADLVNCRPWRRGGPMAAAPAGAPRRARPSPQRFTPACPGAIAAPLAPGDLEA